MEKIKRKEEEKKKEKGNKGEGKTGEKKGREGKREFPSVPKVEPLRSEN